MKKLYFAYGANMNPASMRYRCPDAANPQPFVLHGYELKFYSHATIEPSESSKVFGMMWEITEQCEQSLDSFEGFPYYYKKVEITQDGNTFFFYEMVDFKDGEPSSGYVNDIIEVYEYYQFPTEYIDRALDDVVYSNYP